MIQNIYKKGPITINHIWYMEKAEELNNLRKANAYFLHGVNDIKPSGISLEKTQNTLLSDLTISEEEAWSKINKTFRNEILRCTKEEAKFEIVTSDEIVKRGDLVEKFVASYNQMYSSKGLDATFNRSQFDSYVREDAVWISAAYKEDEPVVFHAHIVEGEHSRLWYSCSNFRDDKEGAAEIGRLNKFLHWKEMTAFPKLGVTKYDWGGVDFENPEVSGISKFKSRFGGDEKAYENIIFTPNPFLRKVLKKIVKL